MSTKPLEFKDWMDARGLKTKDVATDLHVDEATIRNWRSTGVPPRRVPHVTRYMAEWTDPATVPLQPAITDDAIRVFVESKQNLVLHPTEEQFDAWSAAFKASTARNLQEWAVQGLSDLAELKEQGNEPLKSVPAPRASRKNGTKH